MHIAWMRDNEDKMNSAVCQRKGGDKEFVSKSAGVS